MALNLGSTSLGKFLLGNTLINKIYNGAVLVYNYVAGISITPVLSNFYVDDTNKDRVYFTSSKDITGLTKTGFIISGYLNSEITLTVNGSNLTGHYFTLDTALTFWDNNTIRLGENDATSHSQSIIYNFTLTYITNNIDEPTNDISDYRYVTTAASGGGNGLTEGTAWTWLEADGNATAGMTVWVKAGDYGDITVNLNNVGTATAPIKFIGYQNDIGDITSNYLNKTGSNWNTLEMPTINNGDLNSGYQMMAIYGDGTRYILRNIQITNGQNGIHVGTSSSEAQTGYNILDRFNVKTIGDTNEASAIKIGTGQVKVPNMRITNCVIIDGSQANILYTGEGNSLFYNNSLYNSRTSSTHRADYMFNVNGSNNIIKDNLAEYGAGNGGSTHGIGIRGGSVDAPNDYNLIIGNTATNIQESLYVRNDADYNVIKGNTVLNNGNTSALDVGAFCIWSDSDYNIFENNYTKDQQFIYYIYDNDEDGGTGTEVGTGNIFRNNIHDAGTYGAYLIYGASNFAATFTDNYAYNNTFIDYPNSIYNHNSATTIDNFVFENNIFDTVLAGNGVSGLVFDYNNFWNSWTTGTGNNHYNLDPDFVSTTNFEPQESGLLAAPKLTMVAYDYEGTERASTTTIGAIAHVSEVGDVPTYDDIDYYVSSSTGSDANDGLTELTAWETLWHLYEERASITAGKVVALKKGDTWNERLLLSSSMNGTSGNEIIITSYGNGDNPKITQTESISTWADQTGNIWKADVTGTTIYHVLENDNLQTNARFPIIVSDFNTEDNYSNIDTVTDQTHLIVADFGVFATGNLIGANVYILTSEWILEQGSITANTTSTGAITISGISGTINAGEEIFINNNVNLLSKTGDWHYDSVNEDLYIYSSSYPTNITAITSDTDGCAANSDYITIDGIDFSGLKGRGITSEDNIGVTIQNCNFENVWNFTINGYNSVDLTISNNTFNYSGSRDVSATGTSTGLLIERNTITNTALLSDMSYLGYVGENASSIVTQVGGIIRYNDIDNVSYDGVFISQPTTVENNLIKNTCLAIQDGAAIYSTGVAVNGSEINTNILIANSLLSDTWNSNGIYLDESSENVTVYKNSTNGFNRSIFLHKSKDNTITYNSLYEAKSRGLLTADKSTGSDVVDNIINNNEIYLDQSSGYSLRISNSDGSNYDIGTLDYNKYWNPSNLDDVYVTTTEPRDSGYTLAEWVSLTGDGTDANSTSDLGTTVSDSQLVYNATNYSVVKTLVGTWYDLDDTSYVGSITLAAYTGKILIQK